MRNSLIIQEAGAHRGPRWPDPDGVSMHHIVAMPFLPVKCSKLRYDCSASLRESGPDRSKTLLTRESLDCAARSGSRPSSRSLGRGASPWPGYWRPPLWCPEGPRLPPPAWCPLLCSTLCLHTMISRKKLVAWQAPLQALHHC